MKKLVIRTASLYENNHFTGAIIAKDFKSLGYITVTFMVTERSITPIEVNGFEIQGCKYVKYPTTAKMKQINQSFIKRFITDLEGNNKQLLIEAFGEII